MFQKKYDCHVWGRIGLSRNRSEQFCTRWNYKRHRSTSLGSHNMPGENHQGEREARGGKVLKVGTPKSHQKTMMEFRWMTEIQRLVFLIHENRWPFPCIQVDIHGFFLNVPNLRLNSYMWLIETLGREMPGSWIVVMLTTSPANAKVNKALGAMDTITVGLAGHGLITACHLANGSHPR